MTSKSFVHSIISRITTGILQLEYIRGSTSGFNTIKFEHMIKDFDSDCMFDVDGSSFETLYRDKTMSRFSLPPLFSEYSIQKNVLLTHSLIFIPLFEIRGETGIPLKSNFLNKGITNIITHNDDAEAIRTDKFFSFSNELDLDAVKTLEFNGETMSKNKNGKIRTAYFLLKNPSSDSVIFYTGNFSSPFEKMYIYSRIYKKLYLPYIDKNEIPQAIKSFYFKLILDLKYISKGLKFEIEERGTEKKLKFSLKPVTESEKKISNFDSMLDIDLNSRISDDTKLFFDITRNFSDKNLEGLYLEIQPKNEESSIYLQNCQKEMAN
ncbi:hypothetical protein CDIK_3449 [Cucumispora dikerogammari]|nr:hypothetical protein CDIK_3449 [Cucumispora dikerogammari]